MSQEEHVGGIEGVAPRNSEGALQGAIRALREA